VMFASFASISQDLGEATSCDKDVWRRHAT
jgi:hypothetical protein